MRLHSALLAVLTHLVGKLKGVALRNSQVAGVVYPLLQYATSLGVYYSILRFDAYWLCLFCENMKACGGCGVPTAAKRHKLRWVIFRLHVNQSKDAKLLISLHMPRC